MIRLIREVIRFASVFIFGSTGETINEKSGHLNLGIPGIMCFGAIGGCCGVYVYTSIVGAENLNAFLCVLIAIVGSLLFGALLGALFSFFTVTLGCNQNITGLTITTFGIGATMFLMGKIDTTSFNKASKFFETLFPSYENLGWFGELFLSYGFLVYLSIAVAFLTTFILKKTKLGLRLRSVGENPATADAVGINVTKYRYLTTIVGCAIAGLGGLSYMFDYSGANNLQNHGIDGFGWLCIAIVIFTLWRSDLGILGSLFFSFLYLCPSFFFSGNSLYLIEALPYIITICVLILTSILNNNKNQPPASLGTNYFREER